MVKRPKILLLFLALILPWNALGSNGTFHYDVAQLQPVEDADTTNKAPAENPNIYRIPPQAESGLNVLNRLSGPDEVSEVQHHRSGVIRDKTFSRYGIPLYFTISRYISRGLTIKKLIFPFHSFL